MDSLRKRINISSPDEWRKSPTKMPGPSSGFLSRGTMAFSSKKTSLGERILREETINVSVMTSKLHYIPKLHLGSLWSEGILV